MSIRIFIANWKMQLSPSESIKTARSFTRAFKNDNSQIIVCPDFLSLPAIAKEFKNTNLLLGAQDAAAYERGAYTGEVAASDLASLGVSYVLVGHSERRSYLQEDDKLLAAKIRMILDQKMVPVLCVGENAAERKQGRVSSVIRNQLKGALQNLSSHDLRSCLIAYEPVWAIGTGLNCESTKALQVKNIILEWCQRSGVKKMIVLYGGSVKPENASSFLVAGAFDGLLVGGASLRADTFKKIVRA
jgi:triosephosphate isomerase